MSEIFFRDLGMPEPDRHLEVGSGTHAEQTARIMTGFEKVLIGMRPDLVVVVGDVNSTLACSLTAKKLGIRVAHIEAGLRSFDMEMPEEINRKLTDAISDLLFVTEESGCRNLRNEGVPPGRIHMVGNVMIDALKTGLSAIEGGRFVPSPEIADFRRGNDSYGVLTLHRPSNVDDRDRFLPIWESLTEIASRVPILFPVHPRTRAMILRHGLEEKVSGITMSEPVGYLDMLYLVKGATIVLTDSGGLQEETTVLGKPCVTIRDNTERPVTVEMGTNYLAGTGKEGIVSAAMTILSGKGKKGEIPPLWDGHAAERIVDIILALPGAGS